MEREKRVRVLLETRDSYLPGPSPSRWVYSAEPGPAPSKRVPCGYCVKKGTLPDGSLCPLCLNGWRKRRKGEDAWDEYLGVPVRDRRQQKPPRQFRIDEDIRILSAKIERLERDAAVRDGEFLADEMEPWEREKQQLYRQGSYAELDRQLRSLFSAHRSLYDALRRRYVDNLMPGQFLAVLEQMGVAWLAREMRGEIRVPAWACEQVAVRRKDDVASMVAEGMTVGQIARRLGMTRKAVRKKIPMAMPSDASATL